MSLADRTGELMDTIVPKIQQTADLVAEISASSGEQKSGAYQITQAITQLDTVVQQNASASEEAASMAEELSAQAERLEQAMTFFKIDTSMAAASKIGRCAGRKTQQQIERMPQKPPVQAMLTSGEIPSQTAGVVQETPSIQVTAPFDENLDSDFIEF